ncbi:hypothetical protein [Flammeovirga kamogawensis]|uniref:Uncharacterized protein n=1 Tax=Flammeovirga kamogawensis TaxID=373891 RepID=A0ABX8H304_9BACT|nr:hypothetical protein [Flammeovirga kamogawensis]MBB6462569.1 hypothetical protein [Flammeovirga kamogawensis]QWG09682.1 hypothetical protein KM029_24065 [Flammeovirga kamogawensis]
MKSFFLLLFAIFIMSVAIKIDEKSNKSYKSVELTISEEGSSLLID